MFWWCTSFQAAKKVRAHGIGVHKPEEIEEFGHNDLTVLSDLLGDKQFFFGDNPSTVSIYIFVQFCELSLYVPKKGNKQYCTVQYFSENGKYVSLS